MAFSSDRERTAQLLLTCHNMIKRKAWGRRLHVEECKQYSVPVTMTASLLMFSFSCSTDVTAGHSCGTRLHFLLNFCCLVFSPIIKCTTEERLYSTCAGPAFLHFNNLALQAHCVMLCNIGKNCKPQIYPDLFLVPLVRSVDDWKTTLPLFMSHSLIFPNWLVKGQRV